MAALVLLFSLLLALHGAVATAADARVHRSVHRQFQLAGRADIVVKMRTPPPKPLESVDAANDTSRAGHIKRLVDRMEAHAVESQRAIDQLLTHEAHSADGLFEHQFRSWILNARFFQGATLALVEALATLPEVSEIREQDAVDFTMDTGAVGNATAPQWGVAQIRAPALWALGINGSDVVVGSIDSGVRASHSLLRANHRGDYGWFSPGERSTEPSDRKGHGTHTVGTMVGAGGIGVAPGAQWIACQACLTSCTEAAIVQCTEWMLCPTDPAGRNKDCSKAPHVINNSWSTRRGSTTHTAIIDAWVAAGIVPVFSNGNEGPDCSTVGSPGEYDSVISVGNVAADGSLAPLSSRGPAISGAIKPDLSAPGQLVTSASNVADDELRVYSGTSMAAPHVAGAVALLLSVKPGLSVPEIREVLMSSADRSRAQFSTETSCSETDGWPNNAYGHGVLDVYAAYQKLAVAPTPAPPPATCVLLKDVDLAGNDIGSAPSSSASQCCSLCLELAGCRGFTWSNYNQGTCWFKDRSTGPRLATVGAVSATVDRDSDAQCLVSADTDFAGADLASVAAPRAGSCCSLCAERRSQGCRAYSWSNYQGGTCWLKTTRGAAKASRGVVSGEYRAQVE